MFRLGVFPHLQYVQTFSSWDGMLTLADDYWNSGYGRIIMVPRVKLAYDKVGTPPPMGGKDADTVQKVYDIIHPERRNLTAIRGYKRLGGLPDDPHTDPQDRSWYGPHDRLFTEEEDQEMSFQPGPSHGTHPVLYMIVVGDRADSAVWCWGWDGAGDLDGPDVDPIWEKMSDRSTSEETIQVKHYRNLPNL